MSKKSFFRPESGKGKPLFPSPNPVTAGVVQGWATARLFQTPGWAVRGLKEHILVSPPAALGEGRLPPSIVVILPKAQLPESSAQRLVTC